MTNKQTKTILFIILTYILTILFFVILELNGGRSNPNSINLVGISMGIPLLSVIIVQKVIYREKLIDSLGLSLKFNRWIIISIIIPVIMAILINIIYSLRFETVLFTNKEFFNNLLIGLTIATVSALIEEVAWRGFLFKELNSLNILLLSFIIAVIWALWHLPVTILYKYPSSPITGSLINFVQMFFLSIIITFVRYKSGSIFAPALMHGVLNTMILSSNMDDYKIVFLKVIICIVVISIFFLSEGYSKKKIKS